MFALVVLVILVGTVLVGTALGGRYSVAPPVLLIVFGGLLGLIPRLGDLQLNPSVVLLLFLPAILYWESLNTSLREIRANLRVIALLSIGLVIATMATVSLTAQALGVDHHAAWVLGAILAPTDAAAVAGLAKRMPRRTLTVLRAESLINDGTALVLFAVTVSIATGRSTPTPLELAGWFVGSYAGGIAAGLIVGAAVTLLRQRIDDPLLEGALSVLTPFGAFLLAQAAHCSGVVAVVVAGLVLTQVGPRVIRARSRLEAFAFWNLSTFMLNGGLFVFLGVQLPRTVRDISRHGHGLGHATAIALAVGGIVVLTRMVWVHVSTVVIRTIDRRDVQRARRANWRQRTATSWAGFRGAVSLAAALAVPVTTHTGTPFPDRDLIIFITSVVIVVTILVQGTTLPAVIDWAHLPDDTARTDELQLARTRAAEAALAALPEVAAEVGLSADLLDRVRQDYQERADLVHAEDRTATNHDAADTDDLIRRVRLGVLEHKRQAVTELRDHNQIDDIVLREVQATMDIEEVRLLGPDTGE